MSNARAHACIGVELAQPACELDPKQRTNRRLGTSLLEVMAATVCASLLIVPTASMLSDANRWSIRMEQQAELISLLDGCVNEYQFQLANNFQALQVADSFAQRGYPNIRFSVIASDGTAQGGIPGRFMVIDATVWADRNQNARLDSGEPKLQTVTGIARRR